jgi:hypothetical protein
MKINFEDQIIQILLHIYEKVNSIFSTTFGEVKEVIKYESEKMATYLVRNQSP